MSAKLQQSKISEKDKVKEDKANALFAGIRSAEKKDSEDSDDERKKKKKAKKEKAKKEESKDVGNQKAAEIGKNNPSTSMTDGNLMDLLDFGSSPTPSTEAMNAS